PIQGSSRGASPQRARTTHRDRRREAARERSTRDKAKGVAELTDDAVVHGITVNWIVERHAELGLTDEQAMKIVMGLNMQRYKGALVLMTRIREKGRRALLEEYRRDPSPCTKPRTSSTGNESVRRRSR